ncbi:MAG: excinuclease ABC subunit UvrC [Clostridia bacterium]
MKMNGQITEKLKSIPQRPGVYLMKNKSGKVIYVGKAKNLKNRVRQYFGGGAKDGKTARMLDDVQSFDFILVENERDAFIMECDLIKSHMPRYNILLKDDKTYPYIKVTLGEDYPRICVARKVENDRAAYFGPFPRGFSGKKTMTLLQAAFQVRTCNRKITGAKERGCLNHQLRLCASPCSNACTREEYMANVRELIRFLQGKDREVIDAALSGMEQASLDLQFEKAAVLRDKAAALRNLSHPYMIKPAQDARDIFAMALEGDAGAGFLLHIEGGAVRDSREFVFSNLSYGNPEEPVVQFLVEYYARQNKPPREIILHNHLENREWLEEWLSRVHGKKIRIHHPVRGDKKELAGMAYGNACGLLGRSMEKGSAEKRALAELAILLKLEVVPFCIEAYDISNLSGRETVGAMTVFTDGKADRQGYRKFTVRSTVAGSDTHALREVVSRRIGRLGDETFGKRPDLIMVDGGKNQVNAVEEALREAGEDIPVCGMVKDDRHRTRGLVRDGLEHDLMKTEAVFRLVAGIQEETHRFAIGFNRDVRARKATESELDKVPGLGEKRKSILLRHFGSLREIRGAGLRELSGVRGIGPRTAETIHGYFHGKE